MRSACEGEPFYKEHEGKQYCVLHSPEKEKSEAFNEALNRKLENKDFDFRGVWFPDDVDFNGFEFSASADFFSARFSEKADFQSAKFSAWADFRAAKFSEKADFRAAKFSEKADFQSTTFSASANFFSARFSEKADFQSAKFSAWADFRSATFSKKADFFSARFSEKADFQSAKFNEKADFRAVTFSASADFRSATFSGKAIFYSATFSASAYFSLATLSGEVDFYSAKFSTSAYFSVATFSGKANFHSARFSEKADFQSAKFSEKADFSFATFSGETSFASAAFSGDASFSEATFKDQVRFVGNDGNRIFSEESTVDFQVKLIEKPDRVSFHTVTLCPTWLINVIDAPKFELTNVKWVEGVTKQEIKTLKSRNVESPHQLLSIAYRNLAVNTEENHHYDRASRFRYKAMDVLRCENCRGFAFWSLGWWYWVSSGYGEKIIRAFFWFLVIWLLFAWLYTKVDFAHPNPQASTANQAAAADVGEPLKLPRALTYSFAVMSLQKPEPRPATNTTHALVTLETVLGPLQAALLALAVRRKFMR